MNTKTAGWIGVDLDGTLAEYHGWVAPDDIGKPILPMVSLVQGWLAQGVDVRIFTARGSIDERDRDIAYPAIENWCAAHLGRILPITNIKDIYCVRIVDDRAVRAVPNMGFIDSLGGWCDEAHALSKSKGFTAAGNVPQALCLMHAEISEALEELRANPDPHHVYERASDGKPEGFAVELADLFLRLAHLCGELEIDLAHHVAKKHVFNKTRPHKHGKGF